MKFSLFTPVAFSALASYAVALSDKDFVCKQLQVMADIKQDYLDQFYPQSKGKRGGASQPAGGLVVQKVDKNQDGSFEVTASFAAQDPSALNDAISVSSVKVAGLGAGDVDITDDVANPFQWTKTFTVQAEKKALPSKQKRGKIEDAFNENFVCCLPGTFEILIAPAFPKGKSAATSTMASTFKYGVEPVNTSLLEEVDPSSTKASLDKALGVSLRKRGPFNFRKRNDKLEEQWLKTTQMMLQYCWSCGCEDQSSSSSSSSSTTSLQSSTSAEPSTTQEPSTSEQPSTTQEPSTSEQPSTTQEPSTSEQPSTTQEPSTSEQPSTTQEPSTSEQPSTTEQPSTSEQPSTTEQPSTSEKPSTSEEPTSQCVVTVTETSTAPPVTVTITGATRLL